MRIGSNIFTLKVFSNLRIRNELCHSGNEEFRGEKSDFEGFGITNRKLRVRYKVVLFAIYESSASLVHAVKIAKASGIL